MKISIILLKGQNANLLKQIAKINTYIHTYVRTYIYTLHNKIFKKFPTIVLSLLKVLYMNDESIYNISAIQRLRRNHRIEGFIDYYRSRNGLPHYLRLLIITI